MRVEIHPLFHMKEKKKNIEKKLKSEKELKIRRSTKEHKDIYYNRNTK